MISMVLPVFVLCVYNNILSSCVMDYFPATLGTYLQRQSQKYNNFILFYMWGT
jgi:hypothetical protein